MTLRTDLKALDEEKRIVRIHGGARSREAVAGTDGFLATRSLRNEAQKAEIVAKALELIGSSRSIYLDSGSTTTLLAHSMPDQARVIYTSGLSCAAELANLSQPEVHLLGGRLNRYSLSVCGSRSVLELEKCHFDLCILGVTSFSPEFGFCCEAEEDCILKQTAIARSDRVLVLMDSSKYGLRNTCCICTTSNIHGLVCDSGLTESQRAFLREQEVPVF